MCADDLQNFQIYRTDPNVARYQGWPIEDDAKALDFLTRMAAAQPFVPGQWIQLAIAYPTNMHDGVSQTDSHLNLIGDIGVCWRGEDAPTELGISLNPLFQRRGIAVTALQIAVFWVLQNVSTSRFVGIADARNSPSIRMLERLGMRWQETIESHDDGESITEHVYHLAPSKFDNFRHLPR